MKDVAKKKHSLKRQTTAPMLELAQRAAPMAIGSQFLASEKFSGGGGQGFQDMSEDEQLRLQRKMDQHSPFNEELQEMSKKEQLRLQMYADRAGGTPDVMTKASPDISHIDWTRVPKR